MTWVLPSSTILPLFFQSWSSVGIFDLQLTQPQSTSPKPGESAAPTWIPWVPPKSLLRGLDLRYSQLPQQKLQPSSKAHHISTLSQEMSFRSTRILYNWFLFSWENDQGQGAQTLFIFKELRGYTGQLPHFTHKQSRNVAGGQRARIRIQESRITIQVLKVCLHLPSSSCILFILLPSILAFQATYKQGCGASLASKKVGQQKQEGRSVPRCQHPCLSTSVDGAHCCFQGRYSPDSLTKDNSFR